MLNKIKNKISKLFNLPAKILVSMGFAPNLLTFLGLLFSIFSGIFYYFKYIFYAGILVLVSGLLDVLDGAAARVSGKTTAFGGFFDSVADRYGDAIIITSIIISGFCDIFWGILALIGCFLVSYCRARGEAAGVEKMSVGIAERPERLILIASATFSEMFLQRSIYYAIIILVILSHLTVVQRIYYVWKHLR
ncbi:MAG: archaetidylinositol phosphate synthase [Candidatus Baldrarchaeia archaeon]